MPGRPAGPDGARPGAAFWARGAGEVIARPALWATALTQSVLLARPRWWRHAPFLPLPDHEYVRFRLETQYGSSPPADRMDPHDVVEYLDWCREVARRARRSGARR